MRANTGLKFRERREIAIGVKKEITKRVRAAYGNIRASITEVTQRMIEKQLLASNVTQWLSWLLEKGTQVVIGDFWVFPDPEGITRAGSVMQKVSQKHPEGFRVDSSFSGTPQDNFVTRALQPLLPGIRDIVFKKIEEELK
jgi:hypothetical protein